MKVSESIKDYEDKNYKIIRLNPKLVSIEKMYEFLIKYNKDFVEVFIVHK